MDTDKMKVKIGSAERSRKSTGSGIGWKFLGREDLGGRYEHEGG